MSGRKDSEPIMTIIFVVINVLVFVVLEIMGDTQNSEFMAEHGAVWPPYVSEGHEYWRLLTATFMHFGFEHIANNMLILVCAGMILEKALGHVKFTILYLIDNWGHIGGLLMGFVMGIILYRRVDFRRENPYT